MWAVGLGLCWDVLRGGHAEFSARPEIRSRKETAQETLRFDGLGNVFFLLVIPGRCSSTNRIFYARR